MTRRDAFGCREARSHRERPLRAPLGLQDAQARHWGSELALYAALAGAVVSAGATAYSSYSQAQAQSEANDYNARVAQRQVQQAQGATALELEDHDERVRRIAAANRAAIGGSGATAEGSPLLVLEDNAIQAERERARIQYGGKIAEEGYQQQAGLQRLYGQQARRAGAVGAGVSLLSGAANIGSTYAFGRYGGTRTSTKLAALEDYR